MVSVDYNEDTPPNVQESLKVDCKVVFDENQVGIMFVYHWDIMSL